jgi:chromosome partitioning protein
MKIITFSAIKGGVGKTTLTFNYGEWLSNKGYKVLLIDSDHQCSLTQTYDIYKEEGTIADIFTGQGNRVEIVTIHDNLYLLPSSFKLDLINNELQTKANKELLMFMWLRDNFDTRIKDFDYILIDSHPDFSTVTQNMIVISDYIFSPIEPSEYGYVSKNNLEIRLEELKKEVINVVSRESFVTADLKFLGNRVKHNTKSSKEFLDALLSDQRTLAVIPEKELFNRSTLDHNPLVKMKEDPILYRNNKKFFDLINETFETMEKV